MAGRRAATRARWVIGISVVVAAWCWTTAVRSDNQRWVTNLHSSHNSPAFQEAIGKLGQRGQRLDACSACHQPQNPVARLVSTLPPVEDSSCGQCHAASRDEKQSAVGLPLIGSRLGRPAHQGVPYPSAEAALAASGRGAKLSCGQCHRDHEGAKVSDHALLPNGEPGEAHTAAVPVDTPEGKRFAFTELCMECHLPTTPSPAATAVLKKFAEMHTGGNGFDPPMPDAEMKPVQDVAEGAPLTPEAQRAFVSMVRRTLAGQNDLAGEPDLTRRGCTPGCHGEHSPGTSDADEARYQKSADADLKALVRLAATSAPR